MTYSEARVTLAHGSGGRLMHDLVAKLIIARLDCPELRRMDDSALLAQPGRLAFTTDSYVVNPIFFPGGDIGRLAVCGTVNDLSTAGAVPKYLSLSLILEEGLPIADLNRVIESVRDATLEAGVQVVTGDTKVVNRGCADRIFLNTSGIGLVPDGVNISGSNARAGDSIIVSGTIGDHGMAILGSRGEFNFSAALESDCAPLNGLVADALAASANIHCLRDPTRGGLATTLNELAAQSQVGIIVEEGSIPVLPTVLRACEMLGFDPLYVANEGKMVVVVDSSDADGVLSAMRRNRYGRRSAIIGKVVTDHPGRVAMRTRLGSKRIVDQLVGELLPRIC